MTHLISIIIPVYNNADKIKNTLSSVIDQTHKNWECLIIDDGSEDISEAAVMEFCLQDIRFKFKKRPNSKPKGANACRNYGVSLSKGDYIMFLDADDTLSPTCLQKRLECLANSSDSDFVVADTALLKNGAFEKKAINFNPEITTQESYLNAFLSYNIPWTIMSTLWKKEIVLKHPFDEGLQRFQDIDFHISVLKTPCKMVRFKIIDNYYRNYKDKDKNKGHIKTVLDNLLVFYNKHLPFVLTTKTYQDAFKAFNYYFMQQYIFPNYKTFNLESKTLLRIYLKTHLFSHKEKRIISMQVLLIRTGLIKLKYLGVHSFNQFLKRKLKKGWDSL